MSNGKFFLPVSCSLRTNRGVPRTRFLGTESLECCADYGRCGYNRGFVRKKVYASFFTKNLRSTRGEDRVIHCV